MQEDHHQATAALNHHHPAATSPMMDTKLVNTNSRPNNRSGNFNVEVKGKQDNNGSSGRSGRSSQPRGNQGRGNRQHFSGSFPSSGHGSNSGRNAISKSAPKSSMTRADESEVGSLFNSGSKKHNANHLLNFQYESRGTNRQVTGGGHRSNGGARRRNNSYRPVYSKEKYLQANCQFIVNSNADYSVYLADADELVNWDLIEQVCLKTTDVPSCPICLCQPRTAKITKCGHVYCWPCMLHYLSLSDEKYRQCPICFEAIYKDDLKSVVSLPHRSFNVNDEIEMCLMRRERHSLFALPVDQYHPDVNAKHPQIDQPNNTYSKLLLATPKQVHDVILRRERQELEDQYRDERDEPESVFIEEALQYLSQRETGIGSPSEHLAPLRESPYERAIPGLHTEPVAEAPVAVTPPPTEDRPRHESCSSSGGSSFEEEDDAVTAEDLDISSVQPAVIERGKSQTQPKDTFYFYQSMDGQQIYMHALNVQMLVKEYGSFEKCPPVIRGKILEKDHASMTTDLRNRLRYLRHLPIAANFEVCEMQLLAPQLSKETLSEFKSQVEARRRKRTKRAREERKREKRIQVEEDKKLGIYPGAKIRIESNFHFPECGEANRMGVSAGLERSRESLVSVDSNVSGLSTGSFLDPVVSEPGTHLPVGGSLDSTSSVPSFARMLRQGAARPPPVHRSETFPVLGAAVVPPRRATHSDSEPEPEEYVPPPPKANLGDALAQAILAASMGGGAQGISGGKKKGKRKKGITLNITGGGK